MDNMEKISETPKKKVSPEFRERLLELIDDVGCRRTEFSSFSPKRYSNDTSE